MTDSIENVRDFVGEIVCATCVEITGSRVIASFDENERLVVSRSECPSTIKPGQKIDVYIEGMSQNLWSGSVDKVQAMRLWEKIETCREQQTDLQATVISAEENGLVCDVCSLMGFMPKREIEESPMGVLNEYLGRTMNVRVLKFSPSEGRLIVSHREAVAEKLRETREKLLAQLKPEQEYEGIVKQLTDFGAFVDIGAGVEGLVHRSNLSWSNDDVASVVSIGQKLRVVVLAVEKGRISLGHKQLVEDTWAVQAGRLHAGDIVSGKVTTFTNFGAFVRIESGLEGLVHNSELSWDSSIKQPQQVVSIGDEVRVRILGIEEEKRRIRLSLRRVEVNPWQKFHDECPVGTKLVRPIVGIAEFGLFVDLGNGIRGLIHKNDLPIQKSANLFESSYNIGDEIECVMTSVDVSRERVSLSVKQLSGDPFVLFIERKPLGKQFDAYVRRIAKFGAFAAIEDGEVEGLIHISEISDNRVTSVESVLKVGQRVQATVISIDEKKRRIGLSLTAEPFDAEIDEEETESAPDDSTAKIGDIFPIREKRHF